MSTIIGQPAVVSNVSAVSWGAILAGALAAAAISLVLFILGIGLGLTSISPWSGAGISGEALGLSTIGWTTFTSLVAAALGGYIAGRLRTRWVSVDQDEVYFRDTAHGFLAWGLATLITATLLTSVSAKLTGNVAGAAVDVASGTAGAAVAADGDDANATIQYFLDSLFRRGPSSSGTFISRPANALEVAPPQQAGEPAGDETQASEQAASNLTVPAGNRNQSEAPALAEVTRIMVRGIQQETLAAEDRSYVAQRVSEYTSMSLTDAEARVDEVFTNMQTELRQAETRAREIADEARETSAKVFLWFFVSLLAGAFVGSFVATFGGRQRDNIELRV